MNATLTKDTSIEPGMAGTVVYRVTLDGTWIGWVGDYRDWKGYRYGARRWWACWRQDGDTAARWYSDQHSARTAARTALLTHISTHTPADLT